MPGEVGFSTERLGTVCAHRLPSVLTRLFSRTAPCFAPPPDDRFDSNFHYEQGRILRDQSGTELGDYYGRSL
eukprot:SAG22_NODE_17164_length_310_cov_0.985782_1_plen_71_part_01